MSNLQQIVKEDIAEFQKKMKRYVEEVKDGKRKSKSKMNYVLLRYEQRKEEDKTFGIKYTDYEQEMLQVLYKLMDEHNSQSRVRLYVSNERISLRPVKTNVRHTAKTYAESRRNGNMKVKKYDNAGLEVDFLEDTEKGLEMVMIEARNGHYLKSYTLDVDLRELQAEKKDDYFHMRANKERKLMFKEICKSRKLRMSDVIAQLIIDVTEGKIKVD